MGLSENNKKLIKNLQPRCSVIKDFHQFLRILKNTKVEQKRGPKLSKKSVDYRKLANRDSLKIQYNN